MQNTIERKCNRGPAINPDEKIERKGKKGDGTTLKPVNSCFRGRVRARTIPHVRNQTSPKTKEFFWAILWSLGITDPVLPSIVYVMFPVEGITLR